MVTSKRPKVDRPFNDMFSNRTKKTAHFVILSEFSFQELVALMFEMKRLVDDHTISFLIDEKCILCIPLMFSATDTLTLASSPWDQKIKIRGWFAFFVCILYTAPSTHEPCVDGSRVGHIVGSHLSQVSLVFMCQVTLALV